MATSTQSATPMTLAKRVAGEDLRRGDYVAVLSEHVQYASFCWDRDSHSLPADVPVTIRYRPERAGQPLKVVDLCLPFVFVRLSSKGYQTLDLRSCEIVRLDASYAQTVWKRLRPKSKSAKSGSKKRSKKSRKK